MWKLQYLEVFEKTENWFSALGSLMHLIIEAYEKGKIKDPAAVFEKYYDIRVYHMEFANWNDKWRVQTLTFFQNFKGFRTKATSLEREFKTDMGEFTLRGFIDREVFEPDGEALIIDHKISNHFSGKKLEEKARQLYLYSKPYKEKWGRFPEFLMFHHPRSKTTVIPFELEDYEKAIKWAKDTYTAIQKEKEFEPTVSGFFCSMICSVRDKCDAWRK